MPENPDHNAYWKQLERQLTGEQLTELDFDELRVRIAGLRDELSSRPPESEYRLLREEIEQRITGMLKAMAIARRRGSALETALLEIESLPGMTAEELIRQQRVVAARFRDLFGGMPGLRRADQPGIAIEDYK